MERLRDVREARQLLVAIVDDDEEAASILADFLARQGLRTEIFDSAEEIHKNDPQRFDAIILDIHLPGMWGSECGYRLRQKGYQGPIIAISGMIEAWDDGDLQDLGFTCELGKPFDPKMLMACVKEHLRLNARD